ncbi:MAG: hypothetical protein WHZ52_13205, partial [Armatimonadota bacterium]
MLEAPAKTMRRLWNKALARTFAMQTRTGRQLARPVRAAFAACAVRLKRLRTGRRGISNTMKAAHLMRSALALLLG